jgi:hypothetical protein
MLNEQDVFLWLDVQGVRTHLCIRHEVHTSTVLIIPPPPPTQAN